MTPAVPPLGGGAAGAAGGGAGGPTPGAAAVPSAAGAVGGSGTAHPITPPIEPNGEWTGQNAVGSVPGMNDSM